MSAEYARSAQTVPAPSFLAISSADPPPGCNSPDEIALITAFQSTGESLKQISSVTHTAPERIIYLTNRHFHGKLSAELRAYECKHDWNAPTPIGQNFYYYPSLVPY